MNAVEAEAKAVRTEKLIAQNDLNEAITELSNRVELAKAEGETTAWLSLFMNRSWISQGNSKKLQAHFENEGYEVDLTQEDYLTIICSWYAKK